MSLSATEVRVLSRLLERALAQPVASREVWLQALPDHQQALVPRLRERLAQLALAAPETDTAPAAVLKPVQRLHERVGPYRLLEPLGDGDKPQVWKAERADGTSRRALALWLPPAVEGAAADAGAGAGAGAGTDAGAAARAAASTAERQVVMLPQHPQTLRLLDVGTDEAGRSYRVMPFVEGVGLLDHVRHRGLRLPQRLQLLQQLAERVAQAHDEHVALGALGLAQLRVDDENQLLLLDWGQGRMLRPDTAAANLRALGAVLQPLLAGAAPGPDLATVLQRAENAGTPDGYVRVQALLEDLQHVLAFRPVPGAPGGTGHRALLALRRERVPLALGSLAVLALGAAGLFGWQHFQRGQGQVQRSDQASAFLQQALHEATTPAADANDVAVMAPRLQRALEQARAGFAGEPVLRGQVITALGVRFRALGQPEQAQAVLQEAVGLLQGTAAAGEPALHLARAELALQLLRNRVPQAAEQARALVATVQTACNGAACEEARAVARQVSDALAAPAR